MNTTNTKPLPVKSRTFSCPVPYIPKNPEKIRIENEAREEEMLQDRAALAFAERFKNRKPTSLRCSLECLKTVTETKEPEPCTKNQSRKSSVPIGRTRPTRSKVVGFSLDLSGIKNTEDDEEPILTGSLSARDILHQRQKKALAGKVKGKNLSKSARV